MRYNKILLLILSISFFSIKSFAADVYAEYTMTAATGKQFNSKLFFKNGNLRTESTIDIGTKKITNVALRLNNNPSVTIVLNPLTKTYTEVKKMHNDSVSKKSTVTILGNEKVGGYNCTHIRITSSNNKTWEVWVTKDLPNIYMQMGNEDEGIAEVLKSKAMNGMVVKLVFFKTGTNVPTMTMILTKYEQRNLDDSLFTIPADYKKSGLELDPEKLKNMTPQERMDMIKKMMEQNKQH